MSPVTKIVPTVGRVVLYCLGDSDVQAINRRRKEAGDYGNDVCVGDVFPGIVVKVFSEDCINIHVMLDGPDTHWATSRSVSEQPQQYRFHWMGFQIGQAKATSA